MGSLSYHTWSYTESYPINSPNLTIVDCFFFLFLIFNISILMDPFLTISMKAIISLLWLSRGKNWQTSDLIHAKSFHIIVKTMQILYLLKTKLCAGYYPSNYCNICFIKRFMLYQILRIDLILIKSLALTLQWPFNTFAFENYRYISWKFYCLVWEHSVQYNGTFN